MRIATAHVQLHQHSVTTCWTVYFGVARCVTKLKPLTRHHCALCFSAGWPAMFTDSPTKKTILDNLDESEEKDRNHT